MRPTLLYLPARRTRGPGPSRRVLCSTADVSGSIGTHTCSTVAKGSHQKLSWKHDPRADHSGTHPAGPPVHPHSCHLHGCPVGGGGFLPGYCWSEFLRPAADVYPLRGGSDAWTDPVAFEPLAGETEFPTEKQGASTREACPLCGSPTGSEGN